MLEISETGKYLNSENFAFYKCKYKSCVIKIVEDIYEEMSCWYYSPTFTRNNTIRRQYKLTSGECWSVQQVVMFRFLSCSLT